jgi:hypothetical protein
VDVDSRGGLRCEPTGGVRPGVQLKTDANADGERETRTEVKTESVGAVETVERSCQGERHEYS